MLSFTRSKMLRTAGSIAAAGLLGSAHAAIVPAWDYSITTVFTNTNTFDSGNGTQIQNQRQVSWGATGGDVFVNTGNTGTNRSGITISDGNGAGPGGNDTTVNANTGTVLTNDLTVAGVGQGAWITHHNNPISGAFSTLLTSQIGSTLSLWANPPGNLGGPPSTGPSTLNFTVFFAETPNGGTCVITTSPTPCNDIFALNPAQSFNQSFTFGGEDYFVSIFPIVGSGLGAFTPLSAAACAATGAAPGCVGFSTVEAQDTTIRFGFSVTAEPVVIPEPGSLALAGLGLGLFGLLRRRKV